MKRLIKSKLFKILGILFRMCFVPLLWLVQLTGIIQLFIMFPFYFTRNTTITSGIIAQLDETKTFVKSTTQFFIDWVIFWDYKY